MRIPKVDKVRKIDTDKLSWPHASLACHGLAGNFEYKDFRDVTWEDANRILSFEEELVLRIENSRDPNAAYEEIMDELYEDDEGILGFDVGVAAVVLSLSAAGCIPFTSCNGGFFGDYHKEYYPLVGFYARPTVVPILMKAAIEADVSVTSDEGAAFVFSDNVNSMLCFARSLLRITPH